MRRPDNLDALRLAGALMVVVGHAYHLTGRASQTPAALGYEIHTLGVVVFFSVSGYLVCASWGRERSPLRYLVARSLRILPALALVVVVTMLVVAPLATTLPASELVGEQRWWTYLSTITMVPQYDLPGVFTDVPHPAAVNGSLWTLPVEVFCYLAVPLVCVRDRTLRLVVLALLVPTCLAMASVPTGASLVVLGTPVDDAAEVAVFFVAGAALRTLRERWDGLLRADVAALCLAAQGTLAALAPSVAPWFAWLFLPYAVLTVGLAQTTGVRSVARWGDLSYGSYLWAFPVQQLLVARAGGLSVGVNLVLVVAATSALAWLSWHAVKRPALGLKARLLAGPALTTSPAPRATASGSVVTPA